MTKKNNVWKDRRSSKIIPQIGRFFQSSLSLFLLSLLFLTLSGCGRESSSPAGGSSEYSTKDAAQAANTQKTAEADSSIFAKAGDGSLDISIARPDGAPESLWAFSKAEISERFRIFADGDEIRVEDLGDFLHVKASRRIFREIDPQTAVDHLIAGPSRFGFLAAINTDTLYLTKEDFTDFVYAPATDREPPCVRLFIRQERLSEIRAFQKGLRTLFFCQKGTARSRYRDRRKKPGPAKAEVDVDLTALCFPLDVSRSKKGEIRIVPKEEEPRFCKLLLRCLETQLPFLDIRAYVRPDIRWQVPGKEAETFQQKRESLPSPVTEVFYFCEAYEGISEQAFDRLLSFLKIRLEALRIPFALGKSKSEGLLSAAFGGSCPDSLTISLLCSNPLFSLRAENLLTPDDISRLRFEEAPGFLIPEDGQTALDFSKNREYLYALSEQSAKSGDPLAAFLDAYPIGVSHPKSAIKDGLLFFDEPLVSRDISNRLSALVKAAQAAPIYKEFVLFEILSEADGVMIPVEGYPEDAYRAFSEALWTRLSAGIHRLSAVNAGDRLRFSFKIFPDAPISGFFEDIRSVFAAYDYPSSPYTHWVFQLIDENQAVLLAVNLFSINDWESSDPGLSYDYDARSVCLNPDIIDFHYSLLLDFFTELTAPYRNQS